MTEDTNPILLYDGVCGLCNGFVQFVLKRDREERFRFAALQSDFAKKILGAHGLNAMDLDTVYLVRDFQQTSESLANRSDAAIGVLATLGGFWSFLSRLLRAVPRPLRDWGYDLIAGSRYRMFGKHAACPLPDPRQRHRFLDQP